MKRLFQYKEKDYLPHLQLTRAQDLLESWCIHDQHLLALHLDESFPSGQGEVGVRQVKW